MSLYLGSPSSINVGVLTGCIIGGLFTIIVTVVILSIIIIFLRKGMNFAGLFNYN